MRTLTFAAAVFAAGLGLSGCAGGLSIPTLSIGNASTPAMSVNAGVSTPGTASSALDTISQFTITDLQNADASAVANGDVIAHACYPALEKFVIATQVSIGTANSGTVSGAFSAFQAGRNVVKQGKGMLSQGIPVYLELGCAPLLQDVRLDAAGFLTQLGGLAVHP